ncbi:hypothetical protein HDU98_011831 [Podochytrium sp. JEL0797]|nr:hypothetical protein HDU98_011831 [Podochytrium sp. JEL0797]
MSFIAHAVDEKMDSIKSYVLLFQAQRETRDCPPTFITKKRKCLLTIDAMDGRGARFKLFLCNDLIMVTAIEKKSGSTGGWAMRAPTTGSYSSGGEGGGSAGVKAPTCKFLRWIDLQDINDVEDLGNDMLKIKMDAPGPNSLSTLTNSSGTAFPLIVELRIDSQVIGNAKRRFDFVQAFKNEVKICKRVAAAAVLAGQ